MDNVFGCVLPPPLSRLYVVNILAGSAKAPKFQFLTPEGVVTMANFGELKTRFPYIAFMAQWDFLDFVTEEAKRHPNFRLEMNAEVKELIEEDGAPSRPCTGATSTPTAPSGSTWRGASTWTGGRRAARTVTRPPRDRPRFGRHLAPGTNYASTGPKRGQEGLKRAEWGPRTRNGNRRGAETRR